MCRLLDGITKVARSQNQPEQRQEFIQVSLFFLSFYPDDYLKIRPVARKGEAEWAIDPWPLRAKGLKDGPLEK